MKKVIVAFAVLFSSTVFACTTYTITNPNGTIKVCVICGSIVDCI
jgi:hypothetical protein